MQNKFYQLTKTFLLVLLLIGGVSKSWALMNNDISSSVSDSFITTKIKSQLTTNTNTNPFHISVTTDHGIVSLSGTVDSVTEAVTAVEIAAETRGVKDVVVTDLNYRQASQQPLTDTYITAKIKGKFVQEKLFGSDISLTTIKVVTRNGVVFLSGYVKSRNEAQRAIYLTNQVNGVVRVVSSLRVNTA